MPKKAAKKKAKRPAKKAVKKPAKKKVKIKVADLAKELGKDPKELLTVLKDLGVSAKTTASSIDEESAKIVRELLLAPKKVEKKEDLSAEAPSELVPSSIEGVEGAKAEKAPKIKIETPDIVVRELADKLGHKVSDLIKELMRKGFMVTLNQRISAEVAADVAGVFGIEIEVKTEKLAEKKEEELFLLEEEEKDLVQRPPVVTIMGHVDHGKTKLLDAIRSTKVAESEAGGITQHIGAYQVDVHGKKITFLDTPGHEAFTALRARGARVTDIAVLVVAADDGIMPQTIEAIDHARAAKVPIIVAINKIDKPEASPDRVKQQLSERGLQPEDWGGQTVTVLISAKERTGVDDLLEMILLVSDVQVLKANPQAKAAGIVIESKLDKNRGPVATVLIKNGTLRVGQNFVVGSTCGKVRALINDKGERVTKALPSFPVEILGLSGVPVPGVLLRVVSSEREARELAEKIKAEEGGHLRRAAQTLEQFSHIVKEGKRKDLILILKADVQGSLEALHNSLNKLSIEGMHPDVIHKAVGNINESDVLLAEASNAVILGFHVMISPRAKELAESEGVEVRLYDVIYKLIEDIEKALEGMLEPEFEEVVIGRAEVRQTFKYSKVGVIAGCFVQSGLFKRGAGLRVVRDGNKTYEGKVESLKRFKEDVKEVQENFECGIAMAGYTDFKTGDILECFEKRQKERSK